MSDRIRATFFVEADREKFLAYFDRLQEEMAADGSPNNDPTDTSDRFWSDGADLAEDSLRSSYFGWVEPMDMSFVLEIDGKRRVEETEPEPEPLGEGEVREVPPDSTRLCQHGCKRKATRMRGDRLGGTDWYCDECPIPELPPVPS